MNKYKEICLRHQMIGNREFNRGDVVRTVAISERDAAIMNGMSRDHGFEYVKIEEPKQKTEKELRVELFAKAEEMGLSPAKNIKTVELQKLVEN